MGLSKDALPSTREFITPKKIAPYHPEIGHRAQHANTESQVCRCGSESIIAPKQQQKKSTPLSRLKTSISQRTIQKRFIFIKQLCERSGLSAGPAGDRAGGNSPWQPKQ